MKKTVFESEVEDTSISVQLGVNDHILVIIENESREVLSNLLSTEDAGDLIIELKKLIKIIDNYGKG